MDHPGQRVRHRACASSSCYPLAYYLAKVVRRKVAPTLFLLLLIPLWVSEILRSFAWFIILAFKGPLNALLLWHRASSTSRSAG